MGTTVSTGQSTPMVTVTDTEGSRGRIQQCRNSVHLILMVRYHPRELQVPRVVHRLEGHRSKGRIRELEAQCRAPRGTTDLGHRVLAAKGLVSSLEQLGILASEAVQSPAGIKDKELPVLDRLDQVHKLLVAGMEDLVARVQRINPLVDGTMGLKLVLDVPAVINLARDAVKVPAAGVL